MRHYLFGSWLFLGSSLALLCPLANARAEEKGHTSPTFRVEVHEEGKEVEKIFDLGKPDQAKKLFELMQEGHVERAERDQPVEVISLRWDLGLWTLVVFVLLVFILGKLAWKPMLEGLQKREDTIHGALREAQQTQEEAKRLRDQLQTEMSHANEKVRAILEEGRQTAQRAAEEMTAKARAEIQSERERQRREIEMARDQALQELWNRTAQLATLISAKTLRRQLNPDDQRRLVDEAMAELKQTGNGQHGDK